LKGNLGMFTLPLGVFLVHLGFSKVSMWYLNKGAKRTVALLNLFVYPMLVSLLLSLFFSFLTKGKPQGLLPPWVGGIAGYYLSLILGVLPFSGPFFREMDLEFFLLGVGVVEGTQATTLNGFWKMLGGRSLTHWGLIFGAVLGALFLSMFTKYLVTSKIGYYDRKEDMLKGFVWGISIAAGMVTIPLVLLFRAVAG